MMSTDHFQTFNSELIFDEEFPGEHFDFVKDILIYDRHLLEVGAGEVIGQFKHSYAVTAGEGLKQLTTLEEHLKNIMALAQPTFTRNHRLIAMGGGSVGDFVGFVASILKRGVPWVGVPTTWLAALDSAHGGKTALNLDNAKNQIGTFYPADKVILLKSILLRQPQERALEALGELLKMAWISGETLFSQIEKWSSTAVGETLWTLLPETIEAKYKVVLQDPYEKKGIRKILNLGHTVGHAIEAQFHISHGEAVLHGLLFSVEWSRSLGYISQEVEQRFLKIVTALLGKKDPSAYSMKLPEFEKTLLADKKIEQGQTLDFILLKGIGQPFLAQFSISEIIKEARRQGRVRE